MNRRDFLAILPATSGFFTGCTESPDVEEEQDAPESPTELASPSPTPTQPSTATDTKTATRDQTNPDIERATVSYQNPSTIGVAFAGTDNVGLRSARVSTSRDSVIKDGDGAPRIEFEADLDANLRETVRFILEDQSGNKIETTESACYDAPLGKQISKLGEPMRLGWDEPEIVEKDGTFYLFYRIGGGGDKIALATSTDGVNWTDEGRMIEQGEAGAWDTNYVISPSYSYIYGQHYVFYEGNDGHISRIGWAKADSIEGPYEKSADNPVLIPEQNGGFEDTLVGTPVVSHHSDDATYLYYHGWDAEHDRIGVARSENLVEWTKAPSNPMIDVESGTWYSSKIAPSDVLRRDGTDFVFIEGDDGQHWRSGLAVAEKPFEAIRLVDYNPILGLGQEGAFDDTHAHTPASIVTQTEDGAELWVYYQGNDGSAYRLGRATQPIC